MTFDGQSNEIELISIITYLGVNIRIPNTGSSSTLDPSPPHIIPMETRHIAIDLDLIKDFFELKHAHKLIIIQEMITYRCPLCLYHLACLWRADCLNCMTVVNSGCCAVERRHREVPAIATLCPIMNQGLE